jgi:uncharacterized protein (DUF302 family)
MKFFLIAAALTSMSAGYALADDGLMSRQSKYSVNETMDRLETAMKATNGQRIYARVDFREAAQNKIRRSQLPVSFVR